MPSMSKDTGTRTDWGEPGVEWRADLDGYVTSFVTVGSDVDLTPLLQGLPGDVCPSPHWGYVFKGRTWWRFADREETFGEGDAYYVPPGHTSPRSWPTSTRTWAAGPRSCSAADAPVRPIQDPGTDAGSSSGRSPCVMAKYPAIARVDAPIFA
jgi:hypothetical protein